METTLRFNWDKWKVLILRDPMPGTKRFGELKINRKRIAESADSCPASGNGGERTALPARSICEVPPRVEYTLTELGKKPEAHFDALWNWGE